MFAQGELHAALDEAYRAGLEVCGEGQVATYIPELAKVDRQKFALVVTQVDGSTQAIGDADQPFTLQSVSKVFSLACVMRASGLEIFKSMSVEPSGDAFFSIVKLEEERGRARNPYINAGAIAVSAALPGEDFAAKVKAFRTFLGEVSGATAGDYPVDEQVFRSEAQHGWRNQSLANMMRHYNVLADPDLAAMTYFRQCATQATTSQLARLGLFLANGGVDPLTKVVILSADHNRRAVALMTTCGMYDEVGNHAIAVGLPTKSAVSGAMLAIVPKQMSIAVYGPALGKKGNSVAGTKALSVLSQRLGLSLFG
ncbi:MAG: glutaminase A [Pseudomonadota bacterium]